MTPHTRIASLATALALAAGLAAQPGLARHAHILELHLVGWQRAQAHVLLALEHRHAAGALLDDKCLGRTSTRWASP